MRHIGITGGIGCGKTTVVQEFRRLGVPCFVADAVGASYYTDPTFCRMVAEMFDRRLLVEGGIDKRRLADIVFNDSDALMRLNGVIHPRVWADYEAFARQNAHAPYILFESAILFDHAFDQRMDATICVYLDLEERIRRTLLRDHCTRQQVEARIASQMAAEEMMRRSTHVILNYEGNPRIRQVLRLHHLFSNQ